METGEKKAVVETRASALTAGARMTDWMTQ